MYFNSLPKLLYSTSLGVKNFKLVTNILAKANFIDNIKQNSDLFYTYDVKDGERPEHIAHKLYKDSTKHWIILMSNNIIDPQYDWVLSMNSFEAYIKKKYSSIIFNLKSTETYSNNFTIEETVFQGSTVDKSSAQATVVSASLANKTLTTKFSTEVFANNTIVTGATSGLFHTIVGSTYNDDGFNWASNTTSHYLVTETSSNDYDKIKTIKKYIVSSSDYNHSTNAIINRNTNTTSSNSYTLADGEILTISTVTAPVTHYDYELELNEAKRKIILIKKEYVTLIERQLSSLMSA